MRYSSTYIMFKDCSVISVPEMTQRRTDNNDQFIVLTIVGVAFMLACF